MSYEKKLKQFRVSLASITSNNNSTCVLTDNGDIYSSGIINNELLTNFDNQNISSYVDSKIIDIVQGDENLYILTIEGSVYEYNYQCKGMKEIYFPSEHDNDMVSHISAGKKHVIMLTKSNKAYGYGDNSSYQIVPMGEAYYKHVVQIDLNNYIKIDNCNTDCSNYIFDGTINIDETPPIPKDNDCCVCIGMASPLYGCVSQSVPINIGNITNVCAEVEFCIEYIPSTVQISGSCGNEILYTYTASSTNIIVSNNTITYYNGSTCDTVLIGGSIAVPTECIKITGTSSITSNCGKINISTELPITILESTEIGSNVSILSNISFDIVLNGSVCYNCPPCIEEKIKQPRILKISAGGCSSVLVDDKGKLYVLGDLLSVRNNEELFKNQCLDNLLSKTNGKIIFPASELNCNKTNKISKYCHDRDNNCNKMDLSRFKVELSLFPEQSCSKLNVCDVMTKLKECSDVNCNSSCESCDNTVYIKLDMEGINIIISTRNAVSKALGYFNSTITSFQLDDLASYLSSSNASNIANFIEDFDFVNSGINFNYNGFSIDCGKYLEIDKFLVLGNPNPLGYVLLYVDVESGPQIIKFINDAKFINIEYNVELYNSPLTETEYPQKIIHSLIYGDIIPSVERNNYRTILGNYGFKNITKYKNPINNYLIGTYIKGGDYVSISSSSNRLMATYDFPTMYCLNKRIIDLAVGNKSIYILTSSPTCPNELYVVGNNCYGQLGLCNNINTLCIKKVNRCYFDCNVVKVYASSNNAGFLTSKGTAYTAGSIDNIISSNCPQKVYNCPTNKIHDMTLSSYNILFLTNNNTIFGIGSNHYGQLGLGHVNKVSECHETYCDKKHVKKIECDEKHVNKIEQPKLSFQDKQEIYETHKYVKPIIKQKSRFPKQAQEQNLCENDFKSTPILLIGNKCNKRIF